MNLKKIALAAAAGTALLAAVPAFATPPHWAPANGWRARHYPSHYYYHYRTPAYVVAPRPVIVVPPPYSYAPVAPVVYAPRPVVVRPAPVIYGNIPIGSNAAIGFGVRF